MENNKYMLLRYNISADDVRQEMNSRNIFCRVHEEILEQVKKSFPFKKLKEISVNQFVNVGLQYDSNDASRKTEIKLDTAKLGFFASSLDNVLQSGVKSNLKSTPPSLIQDIIASIASKKHPESVINNDETRHKNASETNGNSSFSLDSSSKTIDDKHFFQSLHRFVAGSTSSLERIKQHVDDIVIADDCKAADTEGKLEQKKTCFSSGEDCFAVKVKEENLCDTSGSNGHSEPIQNPENIFDGEDSNRNWDLLLETSSNCSVNSVHTSDLSSYDDEISISSEDEEIFGTKHMSVKKATEICYGSPVSPDDKKMGHSSHSKELTKNTENAENISSNVETPKKELPQRKRKQNPKYSSDHILAYSPVSTKFTKKSKK